MDSQTVFGCDNAFHAYFNLYAAYTVCKWMCVFVFVFVFLCVCVCVCVTAGGVRAQRGPAASRRDVDRSQLFGAPLLKVYAVRVELPVAPSHIHVQ